MMITYSILDPTGNITALVESSISVQEQPAAAKQVMRRHPEVEQVGFVTFADPGLKTGEPLPELRMAGGEFCGNASMSAAALYMLRRAQAVTQNADGADRADTVQTVRLRVSGAAEPVEIHLKREKTDIFRTEIRMPREAEIKMRRFGFREVREELPVVRMEGISHVIIEPASAFFSLKEDQKAAGLAVRKWCGELVSDCLGLMFLRGDSASYRLDPLVYVRTAETEFWENSCASGSAAAGRYLAERSGTPLEITLQEPGGVLRVACAPESGETHLYGTVRLLETRQMDLSEKKG